MADHPEVYRDGAAALRRSERLSDAMELLREGLKRFPSDQWMAVDYAWAAIEMGDLVQCEAVCADVRRRFPDNLGGYLAGALCYRRAQRFEEAEGIYDQALTRFPGSLELFMNYAWCAEDRNDDDETERRWQLVCERFPDASQGPVRLAAQLSKMGRFDQADAMLIQAMARLPDREDLLTAYAWVAHDRQDWSAALRRWEAVITHGQDLRQPRHLAAVALDALGRYGEASQVLAPALRMFPDDEELAVLNAWLATRQRDCDEAQRLWRDVRARFAGQIDGYRGEAAALVDVGRLDEADALLAEGLARFADNFDLASDHARLAERRPDWALAAARWREVVSRCPQEPAAHIALVNSLARSAKLDDAQNVILGALHRFPNDLAVAAAEAEVAAARRDWPKAIEIWTAIQARFPDDARGPVGLGHTLREAGQLERAEQCLAAAAQRFPQSPELAVQWALTLSAQRHWPKALAMWASLKERFPGHAQVKWGIGHIIDQAVIDQAAEVQEPFEIPKALRQGAEHESDKVKDLAQLLNRFESLGDSCEFAMVQRLFNVNNLSLLRWTQTPPEMLIEALHGNLAGVGDPDNTIVAISGDEYITEDTRYYMHSHTFTPPSAEPIETFAPEQCRRIRWLRGRFIEGLKSGAKIFVYTHRGGISDTHVNELHEALCRYNQDIVLVCVKLQRPEHPANSVHQIREGLFVGYLDRFSTIDISVDGWIAVCRTVVSQLTTHASPAAAVS